MSKYSKFDEFQRVRVKQDRPSASNEPFGGRMPPRAVTTEDRGVIVDVMDVEEPGYWVEFFDADGIVDMLLLQEEEIEPWI